MGFLIFLAIWAIGIIPVFLLFVYSKKKKKWLYDETDSVGQIMWYSGLWPLVLLLIIIATVAVVLDTGAQNLSKKMNAWWNKL